MDIKCKYCNKTFNQIESDNIKEYCSVECMKKSNCFFIFYKKYKVIYFFLILFSVIFLMLPAFEIANKSLVPYGLLLLGITLLIFPFPTPQGVEKYGLQKSKIIVRIISIIPILLGVWIYFLVK